METKYFHNKKIFISGGAGVIGSELVKKLYSRGAKIFVGDLKPKPDVFPTDMVYWHGDLNNITFQEIDSFKPEIFIHLAATFERTAESIGFWNENFTHNVNLSHHLMTVLKECSSLKKILFASSYLIYKLQLYKSTIPSNHPYVLSESSEMDPRNLTGMAKLNHESELSFIKDHYVDRFQISIARIFRGFGLGSRDVISRWVRALIKNEPIITYGEESLFDYIYSKDSAEGIIRIIMSNLDGVVNLGSGVSRSVNDVINILKTYFPKAKIKKHKDSVDYYEFSQANIDKLKKFTAWYPEFSLEDAIPEIINYERNNLVKLVNNDLNSFNQNILLTSASAKVPMINAIMDALHKISHTSKIIVGDTDSNCIAQFYSDAFWLMPKLDDIKIDDLIKKCKELNIGIIIPSRDGELLFWAKNKEVFKKNKIDVIVSSYESVKLTLDKLMFSQFGQLNNLPFIESSLKIEDIKSESYVVKNRFGSGSNNIGLDLSFEEALSFSKDIENCIFQPYIPGIEYSADVWLDCFCKAKAVSLRERVNVVNGESQITKTFRQEKIENKIKIIVEKLKLQGAVVIQFILDKDNNIHIIECNPRFGGASNISIQVGVELFYWSFLELLGNNASEINFKRNKIQLTQIRSKKDIYVTSADF